MIGGINNVTYQLASLYNTNNSLLADVLSRIASGKKINKPSDDFSGYIRSQNYEMDISGYELVRENLMAAKVYTDTAVSVGQSIYDDLVRMKELEELYDAEEAGANDADILAGYEADYEALRDSVVDALGNTYIDGTQVIQTAAALVTVDLDPEGSGSLSVQFTTIPVSATISAAGFDIDADPDIAAQVTNARTFLSEAEHFNNSISRHLDLATTIIESKQAAKSVITDIDDAEEQANLTAYQIRSQASLAMIAQANVNQSYIAALYGF